MGEAMEKRWRERSEEVLSSPTADVPHLWHVVGAARQTATGVAEPRRANHQSRADIRNLPQVWDGSFSPWMSNWPSFLEV